MWKHSFLFLYICFFSNSLLADSEIEDIDINLDRTDKTYYYMQFKYGENINADKDSDTRLATRFGYKGSNNKFYGEYNDYQDSDKQRLYLVHTYLPKTENKIYRGLYNEFNYNYNKKDWSAEITPFIYKKISENLLYGAELEIDYYKNNDFRIHEIEIEPTIKYKKKIKKQTLSFELEFPVTRLYTSSKNKKNFEYETAEFLATYKVPFQNNFSMIFEASVPYDLQKNDYKQKYSATLRYNFR